jgi:hypothetical protein
VPAPILLWVLEPARGGSGDKMLNWDRVCAATQSVGAAGGWAVAAGAGWAWAAAHLGCGGHASAVVGQAATGMGRGRSGTGARAAWPSPIGV